MQRREERMKGGREGQGKEEWEERERKGVKERGKE